MPNTDTSIYQQMKEATQDLTKDLTDQDILRMLDSWNELTKSGKDIGAIANFLNKELSEEAKTDKNLRTLQQKLKPILAIRDINLQTGGILTPTGLGPLLEELWKEKLLTSIQSTLENSHIVFPSVTEKEPIDATKYFEQEDDIKNLIDIKYRSNGQSFFVIGQDEPVGMYGNYAVYKTPARYTIKDWQKYVMDDAAIEAHNQNVQLADVKQDWSKRIEALLKSLKPLEKKSALKQAFTQQPEAFLAYRQQLCADLETLQDQINKLTQANQAKLQKKATKKT